MGSAQRIIIRDTEQGDVDSLTTLLARSFFPVNERVKHALPDTSLMRQWWAQIYTDAVNDPDCHFLVAWNPDTKQAVGTVSLRLWKPGMTTGGFWTQYDWTTDHNEALWRPSIDCMAEFEKRIMGDRPHYLLELLAIDHHSKGSGLGSRLTALACEKADETGYPIFLQSGGASSFYSKLNMGFKVEADETWEGYHAVLMVREAVKSVE